MPVHSARLAYLLQQYAANNYNKRELLELLQALEQADSDKTLHDSLQTIWEGITEKDALPAIDKEKIFNTIRTATMPVIFPQKKINWLRMAAAAVILLLLGGSTYLYIHHADNGGAQRVPLAQHNNIFQTDIEPGTNRAILTLADGSTILLDSAPIGSLARQGNTKVIKLDAGQLAYQVNNAGKTSDKNNAKLIEYNTIATPRGGQYKVVLPDGTKVWLNAASSIKFPTAFTAKERAVEIVGEAYLEVAPVRLGSGQQMVNGSVVSEAKPPFFVVAGGIKVAVLGTSFNINTYKDDQAAVRTTLLEGSIRVEAANANPGTANKQVVILKPGQQATAVENSANHLITKLTVQTVNTAQTIAWKNGLFQFDHTGLKTVMRQLERWYDIEVVYEGAVPDLQFDGKMQRDLKLSQVLKMLSQSQVNFKVEGKRITVLP